MQETQQEAILGWEALMKKPARIEWLIEGVLPARRRAMLYAESGVGKSTTAISTSLHIATGKPWQDRKVDQGTVYYLAAENAEIVPTVMQAWEKLHKGLPYWEKRHKQPGESVPPFHCIPAAVDLMDADAVTRLLDRLGPARLVVIDTLLASVGDGWSITDTSDTARVERQMTRIIEHTGATVLLVNHQPDNKRSPLGGSAWRSGTQVRIELTRQHQNGKNFGEDGDFSDGDTDDHTAV